MLKTINKEKEQIWNERLEKRMKEMNLSQRKFIALYKERFGTGSQPDVSKWMHVGDKDNRSNKARKFPEFETMRNIAEILEVSVGYLIGETDFETFEMERASKYTGLSQPAIKAICELTSGKTIPPFYTYSDPKITDALELILSNSILVEYLQNVCGLAEAINKRKHPKNLFEEAVNTIPEQYRDVAIALFDDPVAAAEKGIEQTKKLGEFVKILDDAACKEMEQPHVLDREVKAEKYALQEVHIKMIDELLSDENLPKLLPRQLTSEEIKQMLNIKRKENN